MNMLTELCQELKNWFVRSEDDIFTGEFKVVGGEITGPVRLLSGQYFRVVGSVFNDGVHRYGDKDLQEETFEGKVYGMAIPKAVLDLAKEIEDWNVKYGPGTVAAGPFQSESWGGYTYSKGSAGAATTGGNSATITWQSNFANRLNKWRKV